MGEKKCIKMVVPSTGGMQDIVVSMVTCGLGLLPLVEVENAEHVGASFPICILEEGGAYFERAEREQASNETMSVLVMGGSHDECSIILGIGSIGNCWDNSFRLPKIRVTIIKEGQDSFLQVVARKAYKEGEPVEEFFLGKLPIKKAE